MKIVEYIKYIYFIVKKSKIIYLYNYPFYFIFLIINRHNKKVNNPER